MFCLDKYKPKMVYNTCEFLYDNEDVKGSKSSLVIEESQYVKIYEDYIKSSENPNIKPLSERVSDDCMSLRINISGIFKEKMKDRDIDDIFEYVSGQLPSDFPKLSNIFSSPSTYCFHFPHQINKKLYTELSNNISNTLESKFKFVNINECVEFVGLKDNVYPILLAEGPKKNLNFKCSLPGYKSLSETMEMMAFDPISHKFVENYSTSKTLLSSLLFSPFYGHKNEVYCEINVNSTPSEKDLIREKPIELDAMSEKFVPCNKQILNLDVFDGSNIDLGNFKDIAEKAKDNVNFSNIINIVNNPNAAQNEERIKEFLGVSYAHDLPIDTLEDRGMAVYLLPMIHTSRFAKKSTREEIGSAIKRSFDEYKEGLGWYMYYCISAGVNDLNKIENEYFSLKLDYSVLTIAHYARKDNVAAYTTWQSVCNYEATKSIMESPTDFKIANLIYRHNMLSYLFIDRSWYKLNEQTCSLVKVDHRWIQEYVLKIMINKNFKWHISPTERMSLEDLKNSTGDHSNGDFCVGISALVERLQSTKIISGIVSVLETLFMSKITKGFDSDPTKTAWLNGVTVATLEGISIEEPKLEDMITKSTKIAIAQDINSEMYGKLLQYLKDLFPESLDESVVIDLAGLLRGTPEKNFKTYTGNGDNSKTMFLKLLSIVFGDYYHSLDIAVIEKNNGEGASPFLAKAMACRILAINDPNPQATLGMSFIKIATGADDINVRRLRENGETMKPTFRIILACNAIPKLDNADVAGSERFLVIPFLGKWVKEITPEISAKYKYVRQRDTNFADILPKLAPYLARLLIMKYPEYLKDINKCERYKHKLIVEETKKQWENVCPFLKMFKTKYVKDDEGEFTLDALMKKYNQTIRRDEHITNSEWFIHQLEHLGIRKKPDDPNTYLGWRLDVTTNISMFM